MAKSLVRIVCWKRSHVNELQMASNQEKKLSTDVVKLKKVCPTCKPENCEITIIEGSTLFNPPKMYRCEHGHLSLVSLLGSMINVCYGSGNDQYTNVEGTLQELPKLIDDGDIACNHLVDGKVCDCKLTAVDNFALEYPRVNAIKTKQRIGDLWDKHGIEPVRPGHYNKSGEFEQTRSEKANRNRLSKLQKERNISKDRSPGKRINKATKTDYGYRDKSSVNPDRITE